MLIECLRRPSVFRQLTVADLDFAGGRSGAENSWFILGPKRNWAINLQNPAIDVYSSPARLKSFSSPSSLHICLLKIYETWFPLRMLTCKSTQYILCGDNWPLVLILRHICSNSNITFKIGNTILTMFLLGKIAFYDVNQY